MANSQPDDGGASVGAGEHARGVRRLAKKEPLTYAHAGPGSGGHLAMEYFRTVAGFETVQVPVSRQRAAGDRSRRRAGEGRVRRHHRRRPSRARRAAEGPRDLGRAGARRWRRTCRRWRKPAIRTSRSIPISSTARRRPALPDAGRAICSSARSGRRLQLARSAGEAARAGHRGPSARPAADAMARLRADTALWARIVKAANMRVD